MAQIRFRLTGTAPLLQHNERLADPLDEHARNMAKVSKKRQKTETDHHNLSRLEFEGSIYHDKDVGPYIPATWVERTLEESAKKEKRGTVFRCSSRCVEDKLPLLYKGPRDVPTLFEKKFYDRRCVGIQRSKTVRTRPCFDQWAAECTIYYDEKSMEQEEVIRAMDRAGELIGIGDYRPRFGRFTAEVIA